MATILNQARYPRLRRSGNGGVQIGIGVGSDAEGNVYVAGNVTGELATESGPLAGVNNNVQDMFLMKLPP